MNRVAVLSIYKDIDSEYMLRPEYFDYHAFI
jgi:hypothetical protein